MEQHGESSMSVASVDSGGGGDCASGLNTLAAWIPSKLEADWRQKRMDKM